ncbi:MAG: hypothetical protein ACRDTA_19480 [Pseudonocardiaceae bacterium]
MQLPTAADELRRHHRVHQVRPDLSPRAQGAVRHGEFWEPRAAIAAAHPEALSLPGSRRPIYFVRHNRDVQDIKFAQSARKHRIGRAHVRYVIETAPCTRYPATDDFDARIE